MDWVGPVGNTWTGAAPLITSQHCGLPVRAVDERQRVPGRKHLRALGALPLVLQVRGRHGCAAVDRVEHAVLDVPGAHNDLHPADSSADTPELIHVNQGTDICYSLFAIRHPCSRIITHHNASTRLCHNNIIIYRVLGCCILFVFVLTYQHPS